MLAAMNRRSAHANSEPPSLELAQSGKAMAARRLVRTRAAKAAVRRLGAIASVECEQKAMVVNGRTWRPEPRLTVRLSICTPSPSRTP